MFGRGDSSWTKTVIASEIILNVLEYEMKLLRIIALLVLGTMMISFNGCKKDSVANPFDNISLTENAPTFSNNTNSFAFSINANNYIHIYEYNLNMNTQTLGIAITVTNRLRGTAIIELYSDTNLKIFSRELSTNITSSEELTFDSHISRIQIHFMDLTATLNCAITAK